MTSCLRKHGTCKDDTMKKKIDQYEVLRWFNKDDTIGEMEAAHERFCSQHPEQLIVFDVENRAIVSLGDKDEPIESGG